MALIDIDAAGLEETRQLVAGKHPDLKVLTMAVDIADEAAVQRAVEETVQRFGRIDVGLNDAALGDSVLATHELEVEEYMRIFRTDELGAWLCHRALIRQMLKQE